MVVVVVTLDLRYSIAVPGSTSTSVGSTFRVEETMASSGHTPSVSVSTKRCSSLFCSTDMSVVRTGGLEGPRAFGGMACLATGGVGGMGAILSVNWRMGGAYQIDTLQPHPDEGSHYPHNNVNRQSGRNVSSASQAK